MAQASPGVRLDSDDSTLEDQFRRLVESIAAMAGSAGIVLVPHSPSTWNYYRTLPVARKREVLQSCATFHEICQKTIEEGRPLSDTKALLWCSLKYFGHVPSSDLMDLVKDDLVVELYDLEGRQIFRNFRFMEICSYTLADVLLYPWWELFERDEEVTHQLLKELEILFAQDNTRSLASITPFHFAAEKFSERGHEFEMKVLHLSPLFSRATKRISAYICVAQARLTGQRAPRQRPEERSNLKVVARFS